VQVYARYHIRDAHVSPSPPLLLTPMPEMCVLEISTPGLHTWDNVILKGVCYL